MKNIWMALIFDELSDLRTFNGQFLGSDSPVVSETQVSPIFGFGSSNVLVLKGKTKFKFEEVIDQINLVEKARGTSAEIYLLNFEGLILRNQGMLSPYPRWTLKPELLFPAAHLDPSWVHPVLDQSLSQLTQEYGAWEGGKYRGEFRQFLEL